MAFPPLLPRPLPPPGPPQATHKGSPKTVLCHSCNAGYLQCPSGVVYPPHPGGRGGGTLASPAAPSPLGTPKPPGAQFRCAKWTFQSRPQGRPPKGPSAQPRTPGAGCHPRTTPECYLTPYTPVSGLSMAIFSRTGLHQETRICHRWTPGGHLGDSVCGGGKAASDALEMTCGTVWV